MRRRSAGVSYKKPATLFSAAHYAVQAWVNISQAFLNNCFIKADVIPTLKEYAETDETGCLLWVVVLSTARPSRNILLKNFIGFVKWTMMIQKFISNPFWKIWNTC